jgi:hypothetical protein
MGDFLGWRANNDIATNYVNTILEVLSDDNKFKTFRNGVSGYTPILEHLNYNDGKIYRIYKVGDDRTIYIGSTKQKYLSQVLQNWIQYYKTDEPLSYDIELLQSVPCNSIDELNKARQQYRGEEYSKTKVEPSQVEVPPTTNRTTKPGNLGFTPEGVKRLTASMF